MPKDNNFLHARYSRADPGERARYESFEPGAAAFSPAWRDALGRLGQRAWEAGARAVVLVYGSYAGLNLFGTARLDEAGGLKRGYSRGIPGLESLLAAMRDGNLPPLPLSAGGEPPAGDDARAALDGLLRDKGNFTEQYAAGLADGLSQSGALVVRRFLWPSLHHHHGRMEGALALFHELRHLAARHGWGAGERILVLAYGHAGQLPALLSNLAAPGDSSVRDALFDILASFHARPDAPPAGGGPGGEHRGPETIRHVRELDRLLAEGEHDAWPALDTVTFGTPIRYGWNTGGAGALMHFVNHRPTRQDGKRWLAKMELPQIVMEMPMVAGGDYVHQLAVAGTDAVPGAPWEAELNQALRENLEPYDGFERWLECARRVTRCPADGSCFLIDYRDTAAPQDALFGHACYTRMDAMLFHMRHIVETLYGGDAERAIMSA